MSLLPYNEDTLSVLLCYLPCEQPQDTPSPESSPVPEGSDIVYHHAVGQLALEALVSCVLCEGVESVDVGAVLTQVSALGPFKAGSMAVSGARKVAAVVSACIVMARFPPSSSNKEMLIVILTSSVYRLVYRAYHVVPPCTTLY